MLYFALVRPGSTTRGARPELLQEAGRVIEAERSYFAKQGRLAPLINEFRAHVVKLFSHLLVLAAVRVDSVEDFERCVRSARASGYPVYAVMPSVLRCLPWRNRLLAIASLWPRGLRSTLRLARRLGWAPY